MLRNPRTSSRPFTFCSRNWTIAKRSFSPALLRSLLAQRTLRTLHTAWSTTRMPTIRAKMSPGTSSSRGDDVLPHKAWQSLFHARCVVAHT